LPAVFAAQIDRRTTAAGASAVRAFQSFEISRVAALQHLPFALSLGANLDQEILQCCHGAP
jgi:hypothetical protein